MLMSVTTTSMPPFGFQRGKSLDAIVREQKFDGSVPDLLTELLQDENL
jgi:hypothetical protein